MMKKLLFVFGVIIFLANCKSSPVDPIVNTATPHGEWVTETGGAGGFTNVDSYKNYHYSFDVDGANKNVSIQLTSSAINIQYALFDPSGTRIDLVGGSVRTVQKEYTLNSGKYRIVVMADRRAIGAFDLAIVGTKNGATRIPGPVLQANNQDWGLLGGGGRDNTFKNHFYTFDITADNTSIDVEIESADTDVALYLFDELGIRIDSQSGARYVYKIKAVKKAKYTVMAATNARGSIGKYSLRITGQAANLQRIVSQTTTVVGKWDTSSPKLALYPYPPTDTYTVQVNENSPLDIDLSSSDVDVRIELLTGVGDRIGYSPAARSSALIGDVTKGMYKILVHPHQQLYGNYKLTLHGQFTDFKRN